MPFPSVTRISVAPLLLALSLVLSGCDTTGSGDSAAPDASATTGRQVEQLPADRPFDYQLGGPYTPPEGVRTVVRDRTAAPEPGAYNICYVNAYQTQPDAVKWWQKNHPDLLLRDAGGDLVVDEDWREPLLDISTAGHRERLADIVGGWFDGCAEKGFDGLDSDNLDSYLRSDGLLDQKQAAAFAELLVERAHRAGLAIGQKNAADMAPLIHKLGFDFAIAEECARYDECAAYADAYGDKVLVIEYRKADLTAACREWGERLAIVLRDRDLVPAGRSGHVNERC
ncbi:endo alpha-1,4 polygalactosaminidase [Streptomyces sp. NBC_01429]|uniref:endo alpha-1,4 polygalactosaminidase n=1 Tax=Streptomyces sp. NBC_01429 TaxID=2903862 RepID=UPI002E2C3853|nr:endo alpha-1,4 polygalactosaminidase [Streptomyces sp. NBC_01429]